MEAVAEATPLTGTTLKHSTITSMCIVTLYHTRAGCSLVPLEPGATRDVVIVSFSIIQSTLSLKFNSYIMS